MNFGKLDVVVVSVLAFYSDDLSSDLAEGHSFICKMLFEKNKIKQKEAGVGLFVRFCKVPSQVILESKIGVPA